LFAHWTFKYGEYRWFQVSFIFNKKFTAFFCSILFKLILEFFKVWSRYILNYQKIKCIFYISIPSLFKFNWMRKTCFVTKLCNYALKCHWYKSVKCLKIATCSKTSFVILLQKCDQMNSIIIKNWNLFICKGLILKFLL